jgi:tight adherence protein B
MSSGVALIAMLALMFAAAGLALWHRALRARERAQAARFVERQVQAAARPSPGPAQAPGRGPRVDASANGSAGTPPAGVIKRAAYEGARFASMLDNLMRRAGVRKPRALITATLAATACLAPWAAMRAGAAFGAGVVVLALVGVYAWLSWRAQKRRQQIVRQLPIFLDGIVRLIVIGHSVPSAFQASLMSAEAPLRECLDRAVPMLRTGMEIDHALAAVARMYHVRELELVGSVLRVSVKYGGRSDVMLDRMSALMRDLEQADRELSALSTETRMSSWVLGLLPIVLGLAVIVMNPRYFNTMWVDPLGKRLVYTAIGLQMVGGWLLYRLAKLRV